MSDDRSGTVTGVSRAPREQAVAQQRDGTWARTEITIAQRWRVRVISDRALVNTNVAASRDLVDELRLLAPIVEELRRPTLGENAAKLATAPIGKAIARIEQLERNTKGMAQAHKYGHGEDFEIALDTHFEIWVRAFGSDAAFRKMAEMYGVALEVTENVTNGIRHEITFQNKPAGNADDEERKARWMCSCNAGTRGGWQDAERVKEEAEEHRVATLANPNTLR